MANIVYIKNHKMFTLSSDGKYNCCIHVPPTANFKYIICKTQSWSLRETIDTITIWNVYRTNLLENIMCREFGYKESFP